nr:glycosyltransferase [Altericroceibacterium endophyticum]
MSLSTLFPNAVNPRFGTFVARQLEALAARDDWDVTLINPIGIPPIAFGHYKSLTGAITSGPENGIDVHRIRFQLIPKIGWPLNPHLIAHAVLPLARRLHSEHPFDVVDAQFFYPDGPAAQHIAKALGLPFAMTARGSDIAFWGQKTIARKQMKEAGRASDCMLAVSAALRGEMADIGLSQEKISVHYTGLDHGAFHPLDKATCRAKLGKDFGIALDDDAILLVTTAALIPLKNQALTIAALPRLPGTHFILVGIGPEREKLEQQARALGVADRVHFAGLIDHENLPIILGAADASVLASQREGLANAWVESLACGIPVILSDVGGAREVVQSDDAGRIVDQSSEAIRKAVLDLLANPPARNIVARSAAHLTWENNAAQLAAHYTKIAAQPG